MEQDPLCFNREQKHGNRFFIVNDPALILDTIFIMYRRARKIILKKTHFVLPPVRPVGIRCIGLFKDQHQELVHFQQERVSAALRKEAS